MEDVKIGTVTIINSNGSYLATGDTFPCYLDENAQAYIVESYDTDEPCEHAISDLIADGVVYKFEVNHDN